MCVATRHFDHPMIMRHMRISWNSMQIQWIPIRLSSQGREESLREDHERLFASMCKDQPSVFKDQDIFSYKNLLWAASAIWSRGFPSSLAPRGGKEGGAPPAQDKRKTEVVPFNATHSVGSFSFL